MSQKDLVEEINRLIDKGYSISGIIRALHEINNNYLSWNNPDIEYSPYESSYFEAINKNLYEAIKELDRIEGLEKGD